MTSHFADDPSQLPLECLRGLTYVSDEVSVDEAARGERDRTLPTDPSPAHPQPRPLQGCSYFRRWIGPRACA